MIKPYFRCIVCFTYMLLYHECTDESSGSEDSSSDSGSSSSDSESENEEEKKKSKGNALCSKAFTPMEQTTISYHNFFYLLQYDDSD